jgi:hypothetical protein
MRGLQRLFSSGQSLGGTNRSSPGVDGPVSHADNVPPTAQNEPPPSPRATTDKSGDDDDDLLLGAGRTIIHQNSELLEPTPRLAF